VLDKALVLWYNLDKLFNIANLEVGMTTKTIPSTEAQNNFGRILDDVIQNDSRYVIKRRNTPQAILLSLSDFERLLVANEGERRAIGKVLRELSPVYHFGETVDY
jgi:prevent-host-death family protein